jgi:hypothetical protein
MLEARAGLETTDTQITAAGSSRNLFISVRSGRLAARNQPAAISENRVVSIKAWFFITPKGSGELTLVCPLDDGLNIISAVFAVIEIAAFYRQTQSETRVTVL